MTNFIFPKQGLLNDKDDMPHENQAINLHVIESFGKSVVYYEYGDREGEVSSYNVTFRFPNQEHSWWWSYDSESEMDEAYDKIMAYLKKMQNNHFII